MLKYNWKMLVSYLPAGLMLLCLITLNAHQTINLFEVQRESRIRPLYFAGIVKPIKIIQVVSQFDGTVTRVVADFGKFVHKGDILFYMQAPQLETDLRNAITNYLKA